MVCLEICIKNPFFIRNQNTKSRPVAELFLQILDLYFHFAEKQMHHQEIHCVDLFPLVFHRVVVTVKIDNGEDTERSEP